MTMFTTNCIFFYGCLFLKDVSGELYSMHDLSEPGMAYRF